MLTRFESLKAFMRTILIHIDRKPIRPPILGRWKIDGCNDKSHTKVDMTNEDHCGVCDKMRYDYIEKSKRK
jgi:hypothetical protein